MKLPPCHHCGAGRDTVCTAHCIAHVIEDTLGGGYDCMALTGEYEAPELERLLRAMTDEE